MDLILGVDTSNYTTSVAAVLAETGEVLADERRMLAVPAGTHGLRQSEAVFQHVRHLPSLMDRLVSHLAAVPVLRWVGVGVSVRPRPCAASYMPVFLAGYSFAATFARILRIPLITVSHQEGHLEAARWALRMAGSDAFLGIHLSGGTSDVLGARATRFGYAVQTIGAGADLHAGQFVDRVGVRLGLSFPAGPALEALAQTAPADAPLRLPSRALGAMLSFSGACSAAMRALDSGVPGPEVALAVQRSIANALVKAVEQACRNQPSVQQLVVAGGVAGNQWIRRRVIGRLGQTMPHLTVHFAPSAYASDNAIGVAGIARRFLSV